MIVISNHDLPSQQKEVRAKVRMPEVSDLACNALSSRIPQNFSFSELRSLRNSLHFVFITLCRTVRVEINHI